MKRNRLINLKWLGKNISWIFGGIGTAIIVSIIAYTQLVNSKSNTIKKYSREINNITIQNIDNSILIIVDTLNPVIFKQILKYRKDVEAEISYNILNTKRWKFNVDDSFSSIINFPKKPNINIKATGKWKLINNDTEIELIYDKFPNNKYILHNIHVTIDTFQYELSYKNKIFYKMRFVHK